MNLPSIDYLTATEFQSILDDVDALEADTQLVETITYKQKASQGFNPATGTESVTTNDHVFSAVKLPITHEDRNVSVSSVSDAEFKFVFDRTPITGDLTTEDRIVDADGKEHEIVDIRENIKNVVTMVFTRFL